MLSAALRQLPLRSRFALSAVRRAHAVTPTPISTLSNGIRVATEERAGETATIGVFIDAGSRHETERNNGTAHFLEHLAFKGTANRTQQALELEVENMGGQLNAYTSREHTVYYAKVLKKDVPRAVDILADIIQNSTYPADRVEAERSTILREMEEIERTFEEATMDRLHETAYQGTPLGRTILGPEENIKAIQRQDLIDFVKTHYTGKRIAIVGAGAVSQDTLVDLSSRAFGKMPADSETPVVKTSCKYTGSDVLVQNDDMDLTYIALAIQGVGWKHPDSVPLMVMQQIIGAWDRNAGGARHLSSKLASEVSRYDLARSFHAFNTVYSDTGLWGTYAVTEQKDDQTFDDLCYAIENEWVRLCFDVTEHEVDRAKNQLKSSILVQSDGTTATCEEIGRQLLTYGRRMPVAEMLERIDDVERDTVRRVASTYIYDQDPVMAMLGKVSGAPDYNRLRKWTHWYRT